MDRSLLVELHYLTSISNLPSICERGVLSHDLAAKLPHVDLSNQRIQDMRKGKTVAYAGQRRQRKLHSYANLFLHGRNSMLKELCYRCGHETVAVVRISVNVLDLPDVVIADQNAASKYARFGSSPQGLAYLGRGRGIRARMGRHPNLSTRSTTGAASRTVAPSCWSRIRWTRVTCWAHTSRARTHSLSAWPLGYPSPSRPTPTCSFADD